MKQRDYGVTGGLHSSRVGRGLSSIQPTAPIQIYGSDGVMTIHPVDRAPIDTKVGIEGIDLSQDRAGTEPKEWRLGA